MNLNNLREYLSAYILAPLLCGFGLYEKIPSQDGKENKLERDAKKMPRMRSPSARRMPYKSRTISTTGGTRGRRG